MQIFVLGEDEEYEAECYCNQDEDAEPCFIHDFEKFGCLCGEKLAMPKNDRFWEGVICHKCKMAYFFAQGVWTPNSMIDIDFVLLKRAVTSFLFGVELDEMKNLNQNTKIRLMNLARFVDCYELVDRIK